MLENNIDGVYYLKIDTEGHNCVILKKFLIDTKTNDKLPQLILFEGNVLTNLDDVIEVINLCSNK